jgi:glycosyltransferase involved in cell wall biosynthesis
VRLLIAQAEKIEKTMNILLTNNMETLSAGGMNRVVAELGSQLSQRGHTVTVLQGNPLRLPSEEFYAGFKIIRVKAPLERYYALNGKLFFYLRKHLREINPQVIHLHGHTLVSPEVLFAVKQFDPSLPVVLNFHVDTFSGTVARKVFWRVYKRVCKKMAETATHIVADSDFEADYIRLTFDVKNDKLSTIPLGSDPVFKKKLINPAKSNREVVKLLFIGYLIKRKNVQSIIFALYELIHRFKINEARLTLIGSGPEKANLLRLAAELGVEGHVIWKEHLNTEELATELSEADVFLLLSKSEAYGITVAEALSVGTPCIVTNTTALREFIKEPGCFEVESPPDPEKVARLILYILENDVEVGPFSEKIRPWVRVIQDYEIVYQNVLNTQR